jgi:hypothetical protein
MKSAVKDYKQHGSLATPFCNNNFMCFSAWYSSDDSRSDSWFWLARRRQSWINATNDRKAMIVQFHVRKSIESPWTQFACRHAIPKAFGSLRGKGDVVLDASNHYDTHHFAEMKRALAFFRNKSLVTNALMDASISAVAIFIFIYSPSLFVAVKIGPVSQGFLKLIQRF